MKNLFVMKTYIILFFLLSFNSVFAQPGDIAIIDGQRTTLYKVIYSKNDAHEGWGYYGYTSEGVLKFFKQGYVTVYGPGKGDYRKGYFVDDKLEGEGEEQVGNLKYAGNYTNDKFDGMGKLANIASGKKFLGYFSNGKFVRPLKTGSPFLCPCVFSISPDPMSNTALLENYDTPSLTVQ